MLEACQRRNSKRVFYSSSACVYTAAKQTSPDVTALRELPKGRQPIETHVVGGERERARAYERIREELRAGHQAFVVCPLVSESEALQARAATAEFERLRTTEFADFRVVLLHGQMRPREKAEAMEAFAAGGADVLVATTVIEVGIDVPNATVMLVEDAERYGISQLHQLRGRVGRGDRRLVRDQPRGRPVDADLAGPALARRAVQQGEHQEHYHSDQRHQTDQYPPARAIYVVEPPYGHGQARDEDRQAVDPAQQPCAGIGAAGAKQGVDPPQHYAYDDVEEHEVPVLHTPGSATEHGILL